MSEYANVRELKKQLDDTHRKCINLISRFIQMRCERNQLNHLLEDCVNELCQKCGRYGNEHLGACDGCKWLRVREHDDEDVEDEP